MSAEHFHITLVKSKLAFVNTVTTVLGIELSKNNKEENTNDFNHQAIQNSQTSPPKESRRRSTLDLK